MMIEESDIKTEISFAYNSREFPPTEFDLQSIGNIRHIDLTECGASSFESLQHYTKLETLIVDKNELVDISTFPSLPSLETFWCNNNRIAELVRFMDDVVAKFPNLKYLSMMRNPACPALMDLVNPDIDANKLFRLYVLYRMPHLQIIDYEAVTEKERKEASIRGQFAVKLKMASPPKTSEQSAERRPKSDSPPQPDTSSSDANSAVSPTFSSKLDHRFSRGSKTYTKNSEGNRYIKDSQL